MTVNISKQLLGMACIAAGAFIPLILSMLALMPSGFDPGKAAKLIQFTSLIPLTVMTVSVLVNLRESSEARGRGETGLEQLPRNAATLLTGTVGILLLFTYLVDFHQFRQPDFINRCSLRLRHDRHRSADGSLLPAVIRHHVPTRRGEGIPEGIAGAQLPPGAGPVGCCRRRPGLKGEMWK